MLFIASCVDKPQSLETRLANRPAHLAYLEGLGAKVRIGGAMLADDLKTPIGSVLIFETESKAEVERLLAEDPCARAELFESVTVSPWRQAVGQPLA
ncbi:MAG TPA: YciI family protein [Roseiarcus sp.]|nr:YciI family protein [Roseiarcus sp.]